VSLFLSCGPSKGFAPRFEDARVFLQYSLTLPSFLAFSPLFSNTHLLLDSLKHKLNNDPNTSLIVMDRYSQSLGLLPEPYVYPPPAGSSFHGTLSSHYGTQHAGSEVDGFPIKMPDPSHYAPTRVGSKTPSEVVQRIDSQPTEYGVFAQAKPQSPSIRAPAARRPGDLDYFYRFDESDAALSYYPSRTSRPDLCKAVLWSSNSPDLVRVSSAYAPRPCPVLQR